ncbi:unnamed protein product [Sympodiomycopsis kandeliae]
MTASGQPEPPRQAQMPSNANVSPTHPNTTMIAEAPSAGSSSKGAQHRHSRSRSVNLAHISASGSSSSPTGNANGWDGAHNASTSEHTSSTRPANTPSPSSSPVSTSPSFPARYSSPGSGSASTSPSLQPGRLPLAESHLLRSYSRSPELRRPSHFPHDRSTLNPGSWDAPPPTNSVNSTASRSRNASPARPFPLPVSPRLQAFGSTRQRRTSNSSLERPSSSGGEAASSPSGSTIAKSASDSPPISINPHHLNPRTGSPSPLPQSPRSMAMPLPINPDPEHPFDSVWPTATPPSPASSPRTRELGSVHHWMLNREGSSSPILRPTARVGSPVGIPPTSRHLRNAGSGSSPIAVKGGHFTRNHARSLSGSSSRSSLSSPSHSASGSPANESPIALGITTTRKSFDGPDTSKAAEDDQAHDDEKIGDPQKQAQSSAAAQNPLSKALLSPAQSSVKMDAQNAHSHAHAQANGSFHDESNQEQSTASPTESSNPLSSRQSPSLQARRLNGSGRMLDPITVDRKSPFAAPSQSPGSPVSPIQHASLGESPPKTRSFIGMPPRSGYELSDDPDDVGSEDGASVSSGKDSASTIDEDDRYMEDADQDQSREANNDVDDDDDDDHHADRKREEGMHGEEESNDAAVTFMADEEDANSSAKRLEQESRERGGSSDSQDAKETTSAGSDWGASNNRPSLPKRPSLTRNSGVPSAPASSSIVPPEPLSVNPLKYFEDGADTARQANQSEANGSSGASDTETDTTDAATNSVPLADGNDAVLEGIALPSPSDLEAPDIEEQPNAAAASAAVAAEMEQPEESLSTLERIFLFAKSEMTYHRVIVSRSLPAWIREVELSDAVEYVVALLNGLATDEADVCAAFAMELHHIMWHYYQNCPLAELETDGEEGRAQDDDHKNERETAIRPRIPVGIFTPLICALLLNQHALVANTAQHSIVSFFLRLKGLPPLPDESSLSVEDGGLDSLITYAEGREGEQVEYEQYDFNQEAKEAILTELLDHVAFAMGRSGPEGGREQSVPPEADDDDDDDGQEIQDQSESAAAPDASGEDAPEIGDGDSELQEGQDNTQNQEGESANGDGAADSQTSAEKEQEEGDSSWDATMQDESQEIDVWRKAGSPFDSSSPVFSSQGQADVDEEAAVGRMASVGLLGALSADDAVSAETVKDRFVPEITALREDPAFYVRKEAATALGSLSKHLSDDEVREQLLPLFQDFCEDKIWHVRQAACSSLPAIFKKLHGELRRSKVVALLRSFSTDVSRNVRTAALEIIGEVIYLFDGEEDGVPEELVRFFLGEPFDESENAAAAQSVNEERTPSPGSGSFLFSDFGFGAAMNGSHARKESHWGTDFMQINDPERPLVVAYNFPAVVLTLGGQAWPRLRSHHIDLASEGPDKVRQSLAASLHEVAKIIGQEAAEQDLLPLFINMIVNDDNMEVKASALENVHVLLTQVSQQAAVQVLGQLRDSWYQSLAFNWRLRESLASQIPQLADALVLEDEEGSLMSIMQTALSDPISSVRQAGVNAAPSLYHNFAEHDQTVADGVLGMLADMGESPAYRVRVGFLLAADALVSSRIQRSSFQLIVLPRLLALAEDPVVEVRMALAKVVHGMCQLDELFASPQSRSPELNRLLGILARDSSYHVRTRVKDLMDPEDPVFSEPLKAAIEGRRNLILGPADGGLHKPEVSTFSMDYDQPNEDEENGQFSMDEDEDAFGESEFDGDQGGNGNRRGNNGDLNGDFQNFSGQLQEDGFTDNEMDSDLEMVNIDDAADTSMTDEDDDRNDREQNGSSGSGNEEEMTERGVQDNDSSSPDSSFNSLDLNSESPHHLLNVDNEDDSDHPPRSALNAFVPNGWLSSPGSEKETIGSSLLSLTSPDRPRAAWMDSSSNSPSNGIYDASRAYLNGPHQDSDGDVGLGDSSNNQDGATANPQRQSATRSDSDPFLSFVSGELGNDRQ